MNLSNNFKRVSAPETGRLALQITSGASLNYPLYYFIPSITSDERFLIHHKAWDGQVQIFRLDLETGEDIQLSFASAEKTEWFPWCVNKGAGVLDHLSVLNVARNSVIYFDGSKVYEADVKTLKREQLFELPSGRFPIGQNCVTPDGKWLVYIHHSKEIYEKMQEFSYHQHYEGRYLSTNNPAALCAYCFETGEHRDLVWLNSPIHHVLPYDNENVIFCHPVNEGGMLMTSLRGGYYTHLRTQKADGGQVCHFLATKRGVMYEVGGNKGGIYNPFTHEKYELYLPEGIGYTHTGFDPEGKLWFYENHARDIHDMYFLAKHNPGGSDEWVRLTGNWQTYDSWDAPDYNYAQSSHFHPSVTPDRKWILFTAGDKENMTNHIYLLNIEDLKETEGIPNVCKNIK